MHLPRPLLATIAALTVTASAQQSDAPAPDMAQILQFLKTLKDQQAQQIKTNKQKVLSEAQSAAASPAAAAGSWVEAIRQTQFEGAEKEGAQFHAWKEGDGSTFSDPHVQRATQLYFRWLVLTMQRSLGTPVKELLPSVIQFTKDIAADQAAMEVFGDRIQKEKDLAASKMHGNRKDNARDDERVRKVHDQILKGSVQSGPPVKALHAEDLVKADKWESSPGDVDGMFNSIILPELRAAKDTRVFEYWDMKIKKEGEAAKERPAFDQERFSKETYPNLLWNRAHEYISIGQPNRALAEMFKIVKTYPQHPSLGSWISQIESLLAPPTPATPPAASAGTSAATQ